MEEHYLKDRRLSEDSRYGALKWALKLKQLLERRKANIVTAESLTAGMILKTLVDIPMEGNTLYGGFGVYDTDAKRLWLNVKTRGVYSEKTALQMAEGALLNSRASVSLAVTGDAMPYVRDKHRIGEVYIGVSIRTSRGPLTSTMKLKSCDEITSMCNAWKDVQNGGDFAPIPMTAMIADYIRMHTTKIALRFCYDIVKMYTNKVKPWERTIENKPWDVDCRPTDFIDISLKTRNHERAELVDWCDAISTSDLPSMTTKRRERRRMFEEESNEEESD